MSFNQKMNNLGKYVIPGFFAIVAVFLIIKSTKTDRIENAVCFKGEFDPETAVLITMDDLTEGDLPSIVSEYKKQNKEIDDIATAKQVLKDSVNALDQARWDAGADTLFIESFS